MGVPTIYQLPSLLIVAMLPPSKNFNKMDVKGIMPLDMFKQIVGLKTLDFYKGKGRSICNTKIGTIYKASSCDTTKPLFITVAGENVVAKSGESLAGTLWMCNSILQLDETV